MISIMVGDIKTKGLCDLGASVTLIQKSVFDEMANKNTIKKMHSNTIIRSISGNPLKIEGLYLVDISIEGKKIKQWCFVVDQDFQQHYKVVLGYNFFKKNKMTINLEKKILQFDNTLIKIIDAGSNSTVNNLVNDNYARLQNKIKLMPRETTKIKLAIDTNVEKGKLILLESEIKNEGIQLNNFVCTVGNNKTIEVLIANLTDNTIDLNKSMKIGKVSDDIEIRNMDLIRDLRRRELKEADFELGHLDNLTKKSC